MPFLHEQQDWFYTVSNRIDDEMGYDEMKREYMIMMVNFKWCGYE